ncbi:hypothetical protein THS27_00435 [Thalassospira sp. MCCC 1A01428]|nr:hypothetical protein THS27_00435 [Thalassospira sp. MCCC 1A01428]
MRADAGRANAIVMVKNIAIAKMMGGESHLKVQNLFCTAVFLFSAIRGQGRLPPYGAKAGPG